MILPNFLWRHVLEYLSVDNMLTLCIVHYHFDRITDWKSYFKFTPIFCMTGITFVDVICDLTRKGNNW